MWFPSLTLRDIVFVAMFFAVKGLFYLAKKHAQYVGLYVATEDFIVVDLDAPDDEQQKQDDEMIDPGSVDRAVRHALMEGI